MKNIVYAAAYIALLAIVSYIGVPRAMTVDSLIEKVEAAESAPSMASRYRQTVTTSGGRQREFEIEAYAMEGNEKQLMVYQKPARVRGEKILMLNGGDDIWSYSPKTGRVRHIATHMLNANVMGSDFAYQDFAAGEYEKRFDMSIDGEEEVEGGWCYKVTMTPTAEGPSYAKMIGWFAKKDYLPRKIEYYDENGLLKELRITEVKTVDGRPTPWRYVMKNKREGGKTVIETIEVDYDTRPDESLFTQQGLKRG
jgi:outer membrane lipoprotein-sorting protein